MIPRVVRVVALAVVRIFVPAVAGCCALFMVMSFIVMTIKIGIVMTVVCHESRAP